MHHIIRTFLVLFLVFLPLHASASTFDKKELDALYGDNVWYDDSKPAQQCLNATPLSGSESAEKVYNYLIGKGLTPPQAAGIMGNLQAESGINPRRVQGAGVIENDTMKINGVTGYGIAQWTSSNRQQNLHDAAVKAGKQDSDLGVQLDYLWSELSGPYKSSTLDPILDMKIDTGSTLQDAVYFRATSRFMVHFEAPKDQSSAAQAARAKLSLGLLTKYGSTGPAQSSDSPPVVTTACGAESNTSIGGYALPTSVEFYEQHTQYFSQDHHLDSKGKEISAADIPMPEGTLIYSMSSGKIIKAPNEGGYGEGVTIDAGNGVIYVYGHGQDGGSYPGAKLGDVVKAGQPIMHSGNTGKSTGPHLHITISADGQDRCPQLLFSGIYAKKIPEIKSLPTTGCSSGDKI